MKKVLISVLCIFAMFAFFAVMLCNTCMADEVVPEEPYGHYKGAETEEPEIDSDIIVVTGAGVILVVGASAYALMGKNKNSPASVDASEAESEVTPEDTNNKID